MEQISQELLERVNRLKDTIKANGSHPTKKYKCPECQDTEWIYNPETNTARPCKCKVSRKYVSMIADSGITEIFLKMTFDTYKPKDKSQEKAKKIAEAYAKDFEKIRSERQNSIMYCGVPGSGKTHLSIAICNVLMSRFVGIRYMPYKEAINHLKQIKMDEEAYQKEMDSYKNAPLLMVDDLFKLSERKGQANEADIDIIYEIINARYMKGMPMIISTEYDTDKLIETDQATGSRIIEMCKGRIVEFKGSELNHRLE